MINKYLPTADDIAFYKEQGYWISGKIISDERLELLIRHMEKVYNGEFETGKPPWKAWIDSPGLRQTDNCHWADHVLKELATDPLIGEIAADLMGASSVRLWHDQLLHKSGMGRERVTANVGWHQDYSYWQCAAEPTMVTAWVAFDDVRIANGCMQVVPGSLHWGLVNVSNFFDQDLKKQEENMNLAEGQSFNPVPLEMKAGQVSFHHPLTLHGSGPNTTDKPRRSLAIHLMSGSTRYKAGSQSDQHMNVKLQRPADGDLFAGEWFPVLYDKNKGLEREHNVQI